MDFYSLGKLAALEKYAASRGQFRKQYQRARALLASGDTLFHNARDMGIHRQTMAPTLEEGALTPQNLNNLHSSTPVVYFAEKFPHGDPVGRVGGYALPGLSRAEGRRIPSGYRGRPDQASTWALADKPVPFQPRDTVIGGPGVRPQNLTGRRFPEYELAAGREIEPHLRERRLRFIEPDVFSRAMRDHQSAVNGTPEDSGEWQDLLRGVPRRLRKLSAAKQAVLEKTSEEKRRSHAPRTGPDHLKIKTVDGTKVRDDIDKDFTMGGNPSRYSYIPKGEMWVEKNLAPKDRVSTVVHEAIEHRLMKNKGMPYEKAHDEANKSDKKVRMLYEKVRQR